MKKMILALTVCSVIAACGGNAKSGSGDSTEAANQTARHQESDVDTDANKTGTEPTGTLSQGVKLLAGSDCNICHAVDSKIVGPAFQDVAAKYPATDANISTLANKVVAGGRGAWGDIPMVPHPTLSVNDAKQMIKYILSLKK